MVHCQCTMVHQRCTMVLFLMEVVEMDAKDSKKYAHSWFMPFRQDVHCSRWIGIKSLRFICCAIATIRQFIQLSVYHHFFDNLSFFSSSLHYLTLSTVLQRKMLYKCILLLSLEKFYFLKSVNLVVVQYEPHGKIRDG